LDSEKWFITPLGRSITSSFLNPTFGYQIALKTKNFDVKDIACEISPINSVHISRSIHSRLEQSMKTHLSTRFLSDSILDIITGNVKINKLQTNVVSKIKTWNKLFFDCKCKENPYCIHPQLKLSKLILNMRLDGLKIYQIIDLLTKKYGLFVYMGDLYSWFDELIHATRSISRIASALQQQKIKSNSDALALKIEKS
jgi:helicase